MWHNFSVFCVSATGERVKINQKQRQKQNSSARVVLQEVQNQHSEIAERINADMTRKHTHVYTYVKYSWMSL